MDRKPDTDRVRRTLWVSVLLPGLFCLVLFLALILVRNRGDRAIPSYDVSRFASSQFPFDRGLSLLVFLSTDCEHCREAARLLGTFETAAHALNIYFIILGEPAEVAHLFAACGIQVPYRLANPDDYFKFVGDDPPTFFLLNNGHVAYRWEGSTFHLDALREKLAETEADSR